jgi:ParB/RepB/Spo0J family partition protein
MPKSVDDIFLIPLNQIDVPERGRKKFVNMDSLRISMDSKGLLQPIIVNKKEGNRYDLIAGNRRLIIAIALEWTEIKATLRENLDEVERVELELEENLERESMTWYEEDIWIRHLHLLKKTRFNEQRIFPGTYTQEKTAEQLGISNAKVTDALNLAEGMEAHPEIRKCKNRREARRLYTRIKRGDYRKRDSEYLLKVREAFQYDLPMSILPTIEAGIVDCVITEVEQFCTEEVIGELYRVLKITGHGWIFCPFEYQDQVGKHLKELTNNYSRVPFVWHIRGEDNYRFIYWYAKNMAEPPRDLNTLMAHNRDKDALSVFSKPRPLISRLIERSTYKGQYCVDPISYSINFIEECIELERSCFAACPEKVLYDKILQAEEEKDKI